MGNMYSSGARVTRLHNLQQNPSLERPINNSLPISPEPFGASQFPKRDLGQVSIPSIFEVVKLPLFGLGGGALGSCGLSVSEMLNATSRPSESRDRLDPKEDLRLRLLQEVEFYPSLGLGELVVPARPLSPAEDVSHLTLAPHKDSILAALQSHPALVISAPTSSGKTTWLPRTLLNHAESLFENTGLPQGAEPRIYCSVPRIIQTIKISQYVSSLMGEQLGETCGYLNSQTGRVTPGVTKLVYLTHGYLEQLMLHRQIPDGSVIIFDEAHENPAALSSVLYFARNMIDDGRPVKLVLTSATINAEAFSEYLGKHRAPIIDPTAMEPHGTDHSAARTYEQKIVEAANRGRNKKIQLRPAAWHIEDDIVAAVERGETPIVFVPGKNEIQQVSDGVRRIAPDIKCMPFHAGLSQEEQKRVFEPQPDQRMAIIATNVGGTGLTYPPHVNTVIIGNEVKSLIQLDGIDTLAYRPITRAEVLQLLGRIGRLDKDGTAVLRLSGGSNRRARDLEESIPPEIKNISLATMMLRFRAAGYNLKDANADFIHQGDEEQLAHAQNTLWRLNLFGSNGFITELGRAAARYPVDAPLGKLLAQAEELRSSHPRVLLAAIDIAAIMEAEGIVPKNLRDWQALRSTNANSDVMAQFEVLQKAVTMTQEQLEEFGIPEAPLYRALDMRRALRARCAFDDAPDQVQLSPVEGKMLSDLYCNAFLPWLYRRVDGRRGGEVIYRSMVNPNVDTEGGMKIHKPDQRLLSKGSVVNSQFVVAYPFNLELKEISGRLEDLLERMNGYENTLPLLLHAHAVDADWLQNRNNVPPQMPEVREAVKKYSQSESSGKRKPQAPPRLGYRRRQR